MKHGVRIIDAARGGIIDETALLAALETGQVAAAALDVFATEPPGLTALVAHPNVVATPHIGAQTEEAQDRAAEDIASEVLNVLRGEPLRWKIVITHQVHWADIRFIWTAYRTGFSPSEVDHLYRPGDTFTAFVHWISNIDHHKDNHGT